MSFSQRKPPGGGRYDERFITQPSDPSWLTTIGTQVYFTANDGQHGRRLWRFDADTGATALVSVLESKVLRMPPEREVGVNTTNSQKTEGANAQPINETVINATANMIKTSSRNFLVKRPTKKPCTMTERIPT